MNQIIEFYILRHFNTVSFDIFDTLIERNVLNPTDVFGIVGERVLGKKSSLDFFENRIIAEKMARERFHEVTLKQIYRELEEIYETETIEELQKMEVEIELECCHKKNAVFPFYEKCIQMGKRVVLISDMYLPESVMVLMLQKCGIKNYERLYISSAYGANKLSGKLFKIVCRESKIDPRTMFHIGDSIKADLMGARKAGVPAWLVGRKNRLERLIQHR